MRSNGFSREREQRQSEKQVFAAACFNQSLKLGSVLFAEKQYVFQGVHIELSWFPLFPLPLFTTMSTSIINPASQMSNCPIPQDQEVFAPSIHSDSLETASLSSSTSSHGDTSISTPFEQHTPIEKVPLKEDRLPPPPPPHAPEEPDPHTALKDSPLQPQDHDDPKTSAAINDTNSVRESCSSGDSFYSNQEDEEVQTSSLSKDEEYKKKKEEKEEEEEEYEGNDDTDEDSTPATSAAIPSPCPSTKEDNDVKTETIPDPTAIPSVDPIISVTTDSVTIDTTPAPLDHISSTANSLILKPTPIITASQQQQQPSRLYGLWSTIKNASTGRRWPSNPSLRQQHQGDSPTIIEHSSVAAPHREQLLQQRSVSEPVLGQEDHLLVQMEQLNIANTSDPKARMIATLRRQSVRESLRSQYHGKDDYDWDFWAGLLCESSQTLKFKQDLIQQVQRGVPPSIRGMVWQLLANSKDVVLHDRYIELLKAPSAYDKMIQRDLARTFPGHKFFKDRDGVGQEGLYNVVRAYSVHDEDVGYCQGLAFIVGPLLLNMPDDEAFCVLVRLMNNYGLRGHFTPDMEGLHLRLYQFDTLVEEYLPHLARHLNQQGVGSTMYASQWFMTLFAYKFPLDLVFRIYDLILAQGVCAIFQFSIALLKRNETMILGLDFEHLLNFLKNGLFEEYQDDDRQLVADACAFDITPKRLAQLEKEHKTQMAREMQDARTLDQLQKSNNDLKIQAKALERATATMQKEHSDIQEQLRRSRADWAHANDERQSLSDLVGLLQQEIKLLPSRIESQCRSQFEDLCQLNATLVERNSSLEDQLAGMEMLVIDMKMRYAQSENERGELQQKINEMKRLIGA
ncbi:rab-GTPase-TBC domain-containing protein [Dichotomocladium elegans]|nr:rab-GTPase-TBC domain-containing protein [Dichotomocladium elegans]